MKPSLICAALFAAFVGASDVHDLKADTFKDFIKEHDLVLAECKFRYLFYMGSSSWFRDRESISGLMRSQTLTSELCVSIVPQTLPRYSIPSRPPSPNLGVGCISQTLTDNLSVFAPWCGHCKALAPEYEEAATSLKEKNIPLAKIDCTEQADLCSEYGVEGYPTLKLFRGLDQISAYGGPRKAQAIVSYMTKQALPAVSVLDTKASLEEFKTADKVVLVAYFDKSDTAANATYNEVAEALRDDYLFGATNDAELAKAEDVKAPAIVLYKSFDEGRAAYNSAKFDKEAIISFAKTAATPLVGEVGPDTYAGYMAVSHKI